ncbi:hypothetical protein FOFC_21144 [Fusarium oxysporum]|nr:hypothetical protein FOFC_21144 [Fusarium oxysporum]
MPINEWNISIFIPLRYSVEHFHLPLQNNVLFVKSRVEILGYIILPRKQMRCLDLAVFWVRKQFLAVRMRYPEVALLPRGPGANPRKWGQIDSASWKYSQQAQGR